MGCGHRDFGTAWDAMHRAYGGTPAWQTLEAKSINFFQNIKATIAKGKLGAFRAFTREIGKFTGAVSASK